MPSEPAANDAPQSAEQSKQAAKTLSFNELIAETRNPPITEATAAPAEMGKGQARATPGSLVGQTFNDLEFLAELGRGGMGIVYKARQKSLNRVVAVKLLLAEHFVDPIRLARFQAEARAAASLDHPNIVQVYQVGECSAGNYFTMEHVDGESLEAIVRKGKVSKSFAVATLTTVAEAVHYAHTKGIVHRDLKPANILVDQTGRPVVMDFGIVKFVGKSSSLTEQGMIVGTPAYMAPEQAGETLEQVGPLSDVYSLGAILYTMLTGRLPYDEKTPLRTILKVIGPELPEPVRRIRRDVPAELDRICMRCLSKRPAERFATAHALADELRRFQAWLKERKARAKQRPAQSTMRASLPSVYLVAQETGKRLRIPNVSAIVGRTSDCDVVLRASDVSKRHCQILVEEGEVVVKDLSSANGTFVNDRPIQRARLKDGDLLRIADHAFIVRLPEVKD